MSAKRIRCECGRVYEPAKNPTCPACGATANVSVIDRPKRSDVDDDQPLVRPEEESKPIAFSARAIVIAVAGILVLVLIIFLLTRGGSDKHKTDVVGTPTPAPTATATVTAQATATPAPSASANSSQSQQQQQGFVIPQPFDLPAALASAAPGATIKVPPGFYAGGLVVSKPVKLIGNAGQVIIQSDGRECLSVRAPGVFVQGVQFMCNGIGELAAVSVADGAELELDGCRIQSSTALGLTSSTASLKATGTTFTSSNGLALRLLGGKTSLTQSTFADSKVAISVLNSGLVELQSCAFERNGTGDAQGGIIFANGQGTNVSASDCHFTGNTGGVYVNDNAAFTATKSTFKENGANATVAYGVVAIRKGGHAAINSSSFEQNQQGIAVTDGGVLELTRCAFMGNGVQTRQPILATMPISLNGQGSTATVRNCSLGDSAQFAVAMVNGASATFEDVEIVGSRSIGLAIGDPNAAPAHVEMKRARFQQNVMGFGIYAGSSAKIEDSEFRENNDGLLASDRNTEVALQKVRFQANKDHGVAFFSEARGTAKECQFLGNARGAQSGAPRRTNGRAVLTLEDCEVGGNHVFGVGAHAQNELILRRVTFNGDDKQNIFKERNAIVQSEVAETPTPAPDSSASPDASPDASAEPSATAQPSGTPQKKSNTRARQRQRRPEDDASRILRHIFGPH